MNKIFLTLITAIILTGCATSKITPEGAALAYSIEERTYVLPTELDCVKNKTKCPVDPCQDLPKLETGALSEFVNKWGTAKEVNKECKLDRDTFKNWIIRNFIETK